MTTVLFFFFLFKFAVAAQPPSISTSIPLPPLQWLNLSALLSGPSPPPLKDPSIAYDDSTRSLLVFGGESEGGFVQSQTYLLNLDTLTWSTPSPPATLRTSPSPRSAALAGNDFAASNRHGFVIYGGKGPNSQPLSDVWEYDYNNQFWSRVVLSPGGPSPRWGAAGGIDVRISPIQDPVVPGPNNTFYLAGGFDGTSLSSLSDIWMLQLSGTLSSNMPNTATGSWVNISFGALPPSFGHASTMLHQNLVIAGGCTDTPPSPSCAQPVSHILDLVQKTQISPPSCPAPRMGALLVPNVNGFSSSFSSQVFLLLGTFDSSRWQDDGGLANGEVAVLDANTGAWGRVLPSGEPGNGGRPSFPSPREGAAAYAHTSALVGSSRSSAADTIIFGGRDASGRYLSEVWLLRSYNGTITASQQTWSGFGDGRLQSGIDANGAGVTLQYMSTCASPLNSTDPSNTPRPSTADSRRKFPFDTSVSHKVLAPISLAFLLPAVFLFRLALPSFQFETLSHWPIALVSVAGLSAILSYGMGIAGIAASFITVRSNGPSVTGSRVTLRTAHGQAGLALFLALYVLVPVLFCFRVCFTRPSTHDTTDQKNEKVTAAKPDTSGVPSPPHSVHAPSRPISPSLPLRVPAWDRVRRLWMRHGDPAPIDSDSESAVPVTQGFEVLNRPPRTRTRTHDTSTSWPVAASAPSDLRHIEWLRRRRSLNTVGELDYIITQSRRAQASEAAAATLPVPSIIPTQPVMPDSQEVILRSIFHSLLIALCIVTLVALWARTPPVFFAIFLLWTLVFYLSILFFAWLGKPSKSIAAALMSRMRPSPISSAAVGTNQPSDLEPGVNQVPFQTKTQGPYLNQPPYVTVQGDNSTLSPRSVEADDDNEDEDEDEDTRQRRIEEEMSRRDVSIVTVPKRRLWIANPT